MCYLLAGDGDLRRRPAMATGNGDGKDNDKSTLSQAGEGANTKEEER